MVKVLAISNQDLRHPFHGSARLQLSLLGALALTNSEVLYVNVASNGFSQQNIRVTSSFGRTSFKQINIPGMTTSNYAKYLKSLNVLEGLLDIKPEVLFCLSRHTIILCKILSKKLGVPLILLHDALRYLYLHQLLRSTKTRIKEVFYSVPALISYAIITLLSSASLSVSEDFKLYFNKLLLKNKIYEIKPTFMLLNDHDCNSQEMEDLSTLPEDLFLYSGPLWILKYIASKTPRLNYVVTGPVAFNVKNQMHNRLKNIHPLHNICDIQLCELHKRIRAAVILRESMTGISMTVVQELYFGKPIIANSIAISGIRGLKDVRGISVVDNIPKLLTLLNHAPEEDEELFKEKRLNALEFFEKNLSPPICGNLIREIITHVLES